MRCNNCGFDNDPGVRTCVKCGCSLTEQAVMGYDNYRPSYRDEELRQTSIYHDGMQRVAPVKETVVYGNGVGAREKETRVQSVCPRCHCPMTGDYCSNCGYEKESDQKPAVNEGFLKSHTNKCQNCGREVPLDFRHCPDCGVKIEAETINPFISKHEEEKSALISHQCVLIPLEEVDDDVKEGTALDFSGDSIILNRANTDPSNRTITSKEHAELIFEDGGWSIVNRSEFKATMVVANRKINLQSGDTILLGNKRFRFEVKD